MVKHTGFPKGTGIWMADGRHLEKSKNVVLMDSINSLLKTDNKTANINVKTVDYTHC